MAKLAAPMLPATEPQPHRFTVDDVFAMGEAGILDPDARVELLDGVLYDVNPPAPSHAGAVGWLNRQLVLSLPDHEVRVQDTLLVAGGFVSPDLLMITEASRTELPSTAVLAVEVAVTSHRHDTRKAARYARAGVGEYWLVDVPGRRVLVHRAPLDGAYDEVTTLRDGDRLRLPTGGPALDVTELLGPVAPAPSG